MNALTAAEELIVPIQCEYYALEGLGQLLRNVSLVQQNINPGLRLSGIVMTMFDPRTKLSEQVVAEVRNYFGDLVYGVIIPRTVRLSEAPGFGQPITVYDPKSKGAESYRELAREVAVRPPPTEPMPVYEDLPTVVVPPVDSRPPRPRLPRAVEPIEERRRGGRGPRCPEPFEPEPAARARSLNPNRAGTRARQPEPEPAPQPEPAPASPSLDADRRCRTGVEAAEDDIWEDAGSVVRRRACGRRASPAPPGHLPERRVVVIDEDAYDGDVRSRHPQAPRPAAAPARPRPTRADIGATLEDEDGAPRRRWRLFRKGGE